MKERDELLQTQMRERDEFYLQKTRRLERKLADSEKTKPGNDEEVEPRANFRSTLKSGVSRRLSFASDAGDGAGESGRIQLSHFR